jgi:pimeloyl-ACP methyl ester carboxylesterase
VSIRYRPYRHDRCSHAVYPVPNNRTAQTERNVGVSGERLGEEVAVLEDAHEDRFTSWDGTQIVYHQWGLAWVEPPVVLHHGFAADAHVNWLYPGIVDALVGAGRHVVAVDARGHGRSAKPHDPAAYGEAQMARDVSALIDRLGVDAVDLVGYSMGAVVALITAAHDPRVRRLVVGGVGAGVVEVGGVDTRVVPDETMRAALEADDPESIGHPDAAAFRAFADVVGGDRRALAAQAAATHQAPIPLERITAPTLVLAGDVDPLAARPEVLARAIPDAGVRTLSGDHFGAVTDPECACAVVEFLGDGIGMLPRDVLHGDAPPEVVIQELLPSGLPVADLSASPWAAHDPTPPTDRR